MKLIIADIEARGFEPHLGVVNSEMVGYYRKFGFVCVGETLEMRKSPEMKRQLRSGSPLSIGRRLTSSGKSFHVQPLRGIIKALPFHHESRSEYELVQ